MTQDLKSFIRTARKAAAPILAISTSDQPADEGVIREVLESLKASAIIRWTCLFGFEALTDSAKDVITALADGMDPEAATQRFEDGFGRVIKDLQKKAKDRVVAEGTSFLAWNAHRFLDNPLVIQAIMAMRDRFKSTNQTLVLLGPSFQFPAELANDVLSYDVAYPGREQLGEIVTDLYAQADQAPKLTQGALDKYVSAIQGLPSFGAEQATSVSISRKGLDLDALRERKRLMVAQTRGASIWAGRDKFEDVGGCGAVKSYLTDFMNGPDRPEALVFLDEIDKAMAGSAGGDTSGVSQDILGAILSWMDGTSGKTVPGALFLGPPGAAKSALTKSAGGEFDLPVIVGDIGAMKDSLVGESGKNVRAFLKMVDAVSNGRPLLVATCNGIETLKPELRRRFTSEWFFDLPTKKDRDQIWKIWTKKFGVKDEDRPEDEGWTGAEIRKACEMAWRLRRSLAEAGKLVVPVSVSAQAQIEQLRASATNRFLDASTGLPYKPLGKLASLVVEDRGERKRQLNVND